MLALAAAACQRKGQAIEPEPEPVGLLVVNRGFFDVDVYVVMSTGASSAIRVGTVSGFSQTHFVLRPNQLQAGRVLQLRLHPIGTTVNWTTPTLSLSPGEQAELDINSDANGGLSRTVLYPLPDTTSAPLPR